MTRFRAALASSADWLLITSGFLSRGLCLKTIEELGDGGLPLSSAERLAFPAR